MLGFEFLEADAADYCKIVESPEFFGEAALTYEQSFAFVTPSLQVVGVVTILDESNSAILFVDMVPAHDGSDHGAMHASNILRFAIRMIGHRRLYPGCIGVSRVVRPPQHSHCVKDGLVVSISYSLDMNRESTTPADERRATALRGSRGDPREAASRVAWQTSSARRVRFLISGRRSLPQPYPHICGRTGPSEFNRRCDVRWAVRVTTPSSLLHAAQAESLLCVLASPDSLAALHRYA